MNVDTTTVPEKPDKTTVMKDVESVDQDDPDSLLLEEVRRKQKEVEKILLQEKEALERFESSLEDTSQLRSDMKMR